MSNNSYLYSISRNYVRCRVWWGLPRSHELVGTSTITPDKGLKLAERKRIIDKWLHEQCGVQQTRKATKQ